MSALVLMYHAVADGPRPLCLDPELFARHARTIAESDVEAVTVNDLAARLRGGDERPAVAITFDDGMASVAEVAAPILAEHGLVATVFCVAGRIGGRSDWPSARPGAPVFELASAEQLRALAAAGWEIGAHGVEHEPLAELEPSERRRVVAVSRELLESELGVEVRSFAFPYGSVPVGPEGLLREAGYVAGCATRLARVTAASDPYALPRVDAHYLARPSLLAAALDGGAGAYLAARSIAARARRLGRADYRQVA